MKILFLSLVFIAALFAPLSFSQPASEFIVPLGLLDDSAPMRMQLIPGGAFHADVDNPTLMPEFYISAYEVTQAQWQAVMGEENNSFYSGTNRPMELNFSDAQRLVAKLNELGVGEFRLPWEIEWEYAARAGTASPFWFGDGPKAVGQKEANAWGLFDVHGNVSEWCLDGRVEPADPDVPDDEPTPLRVVKGGSWGDAAAKCAIASRSELPEEFRSPALGARLVLISNEMTSIQNWKKY